MSGPNAMANLDGRHTPSSGHALLGLKLSFPPGSRIGWRLLFGALACAGACWTLLLSRHAVRPDPAIGLNLAALTLAGVVFAWLLVSLAVCLPDKLLPKLLVFPLAAGVFAATAGIPFELKFLGSKFESSRLVADCMGQLLEDLGLPEVAGACRRLPYVAPVLTGSTVAVLSTAGLLAVRLKAGASWSARLVLYASGPAAALAVRLLVPSVVLLRWPSSDMCAMGLGNGSWLLLAVFVPAIDLGQMFGASDLLACRRRTALGALAVAAGVATAVLWKPIAAEAYYWKAMAHLAGNEDGSHPDWREPAAKALASAHRLRPTNERNAFAYATLVLQEEAWKALRREDYAAAIDLQMRATEIFPRAPALYSTLGMLYRRKGDYREALRYAHRALELAEKVSPEDYRRWGTFGMADSEYKKQLIDALRREGSESSVRDIRAFVDCGDEEVSTHAAEALKKIRGEEALK